MPDPVLAPIRRQFRALTSAFVPEAGSLDGAAWAEAEELIDRTLRARTSRERRQVRLFVRGLDLLSLMRFGRRLAAVDAARTRRLLATLQDCRLGLVRRGVWGTRTLAFLAYYGRRSVYDALGYRADPAGWSVRDSSSGPR